MEYGKITEKELTDIIKELNVCLTNKPAIWAASPLAWEMFDKAVQKEFKNYIKKNNK